MDRPGRRNGAERKRAKRGEGRTSPLFARSGRRAYLAAWASAACFLRWSQLYLRWNFSTRPVVSTNFILPVKNGWHAEQISTVMFLRVLRVTNLLPQPHVTVASTYSGWIFSFMALSPLPLS